MIFSGDWSIDTNDASGGIAGHDRFPAAGPVGLRERAILVKISANDGGAPASGGKAAEP